MDKIYVKFDGFSLFENLSMKFYPGLNFLIGPNGSGKTTILKLLSNIITPNDGRIVFKTHDKPKIDISFQNPELSLFHPKVKDELKDGLKNNRKLIEFGTDLLELQNYMDSDLSEVGINIKKKLTILSTLSRNPDVILLDEPTQSLTISDMHQVFKLINHLLKMGKTIICVTHLSHFISMFNNITYNVVDFYNFIR